VGIVDDTPDDLEKAAEDTVSNGAVESDGAAEDGGVVDSGGAVEEDGGAGGTEADGRGPDITDTMLIGLRIQPGISLSE
jgi:hypothetical protein